MLTTLNAASDAYTGEFHHSLDGKKRVTIPSTWRRNETDDFVIVPHPTESCLMVMPPEVFKRIGEQAKAGASSPEHYRHFVRRFYSKAQSVSTDKAGRLLLPEAHCAQADLVGDTVLIGCDDRIEIWSPANWTKYLEDGADGIYTEVARGAGI